MIFAAERKAASCANDGVAACAGAAWLLASLCAEHGMLRVSSVFLLFLCWSCAHFLVSRLSYCAHRSCFCRSKLLPRACCFRRCCPSPRVCLAYRSRFLHLACARFLCYQHLSPCELRFSRHFSDQRRLVCFVLCTLRHEPVFRHVPAAVSYTHLTLPTICSV